MNLVEILEREGFVPSNMLVTTNMEAFHKGYRVAAVFGQDLNLLVIVTFKSGETYGVRLEELDTEFSPPPAQSSDEWFDRRFQRMRFQTSQMKNAIAWAKSLIDEAIAATQAA